MQQPDYQAAIDYALVRLEKELPAHFLYHSFAHTRDDVLVAIRRFAEIMQLGQDDLHLLEVGAVFHDLGFLYQTAGHEQRGADLAAEVLPGYGFSADQARRVSSMIMATRLPQNPQNLLEELLADADLDVLGREDFMARNDLLRQELGLMGTAFTDEKWYSSQLKFLETHTYFSEAARQVRGAGKVKNIAQISAKLKAITGMIQEE